MSNGQWSWLDDSKTAIYSVGGTSKATITGLANNVTSYLSVDDNGTFTVSKEAFNGLSNGSTISLTGNYELKLEAGLATAAAISSASLTFSGINGGSATITGKFIDYYTSTGTAITFHTDAALESSRNLATISGLSSTAKLQFADDKKTIKLDATDFTTSNVSLSTGTVSGVNVGNYGFNFKLYTKDNGDVADEVGASLGFGADADR